MPSRTKLNAESEIVETIAEFAEAVGKHFDSIDQQFVEINERLGHIESVIIKEYGGRLDALEQKVKN